MPAISTALRYRNFPGNNPTATNLTPRGSSSLGIFEKEPERDAESDCFMCRQANVYVKPIGMQQELRVGDNRPPPLTREEIDELSQKKTLTKKQARRLLQCFFPEIKNTKHFQLHRYHSCCYDPKHLTLCKNHITALQNEREKHPDHHHHGKNGDENYYEEHERESRQQNRVSFVRIKIEPTKGIPTRFLGPAVLPEALADMLIKQVNRFETKKTFKPTTLNHAIPSYNTNKVTNDIYGFDRINYEDADDDDDDEEEEEDDDDDDDDRDDDEGIGGGDDDHYHGGGNDDDTQITSKSSRTGVTTTKKPNRRKKPKLKHWELLALQNSKQETCGCRHHVTRVEDDKLVHDWCRCKDHRHNDSTKRRHSIALAEPSPREIRLKLNQISYDWCKCKNHRHEKSTDGRKSIALPAISNREMGAGTGRAHYDWCQCKDPPHKVSMRKKKSINARPRAESEQAILPISHRIASVQVPPLSLSTPVQPRHKRREVPKHIILSTSQREEPVPLRPKTHKKSREIHTRTYHMEARERPSTEFAVAYDPSAVDYDVIQEAIYYRTSSGRLIKPKITNSFTYDSGLPSKTGNHQRLNSNRDTVLYMAHNGHSRIPEDDERPRTKKNGDSTRSKSVILSHPGSVYRGQAYFDPEHLPPNNDTSNNMPLLKLPSLETKSTQYNYDNQNEYQPAEFTLAKLSNNSRDTPTPQATHSTEARKPVPMSMQTSTKPTYINANPTPNFGGQSILATNRRWFDQPLGDQNLRPVHDSEYGVIAAASSEPHQNKFRSGRDPIESGAQKKENKCTIS